MTDLIECAWMDHVTCVIRERRASDLPDCVELLAHVHLAHRYPINWPDEPSSWLTPPDMVAAWVATRDDEVVGHVCVARKDPRTPDLDLERLFVSPVAAGAGAGSGLLGRASQWADERGSHLALNVAENCTKAVRLYRRLGWQQTGETPIDWGENVAHRVLHFEAPPA